MPAARRNGCGDSYVGKFMTLAIVTLVAAMAQPVSWSGSPVWRADSADAAHLRTVFHKVDITLTQDSARYVAKTLYKNTGNVALTGQLLVPVIGKDATDDWFKTEVKAKWGDAPLMTQGLENEPNGARWHRFKVSLDRGEWKAFESTLTRPLNKSGEGWAERFVTYLMQPCDDTLEQFQLSIKYPRGFVFQTVAVSPNFGWQVGETGAFYSKKNWLPGKTAFRFQFYPGTFEKIGR